MNDQIIRPEPGARYACDVSLEAAETYIRAARQQMKHDRAAGMASFDDIFRSCEPPRAMNGRFGGELLAVDFVPGFNQYAAWVQRRFRPWLGKVLDSETATGDNIFDRAADPWLRLMMPLYRRRLPDTPATFRAVKFRTMTAPSLGDPDMAVLRLDYDLPPNPAHTVRRIVDEVVELADGYYFGRAFVHLWWGPWVRVAYFSLRAT